MLKQKVIECFLKVEYILNVNFEHIHICISQRGPIVISTIHYLQMFIRLRADILHSKMIWGWFCEWQRFIQYINKFNLLIPNEWTKKE